MGRSSLTLRRRLWLLGTCQTLILFAGFCSSPPPRPLPPPLTPPETDCRTRSGCPPPPRPTPRGRPWQCFKQPSGPLICE